MKFPLSICCEVLYCSLLYKPIPLPVVQPIPLIASTFQIGMGYCFTFQSHLYENVRFDLNSCIISVFHKKNLFVSGIESILSQIKSNDNNKKYRFLTIKIEKVQKKTLV